ncbi:MAG: HesA/MoeB/ThiF family protein [Muribaculaceae bacterium]|nr:HesA/MoeB/ThiF family protein [Muribaculaceae bacterium]
MIPDKMRYARQIAVPEIGKEGQEKICKGKVLVIGCGALGSMVAMQLAGAGVGEIGIADFDNIDISNLQRQFFFRAEEAGKSKMEVLRQRLQELNPEIKVRGYKEMITSGKADKIFGDYDFIVDATDNPESKRMTGTMALKKAMPCCIGGVRDFGGQVMTFLPESPRFEEYFGTASADGFLPCSLGGVMGPAAGLCASIQASETLKYLSGTGDLLSGRLLIFDLLKNSFQLFHL